MASWCKPVGQGMSPPSAPRTYPTYLAQWSTVVPLALFGGFFAASCYSLRHTDPKRLLRRRTVSGIGCGLGYLWTNVAVDLYQTIERTEEPAYDDHPERPLWEAAEFISDEPTAQNKLHAHWAYLKGETRPADWGRFLEITARQERDFLQRDGIGEQKSSIVMSALTTETDRWTRMGDRIRLMSSSLETRTLCAVAMSRFNWTEEMCYTNSIDYTRAVIYVSTLANWDTASVCLPPSRTLRVKFTPAITQDFQTKSDSVMLASALAAFYARNRCIARASSVLGLCTVAANVLSAIQCRQYLYEPSTFCDPYAVAYVVRWYLNSLY